MTRHPSARPFEGLPPQPELMDAAFHLAFHYSGVFQHFQVLGNGGLGGAKLTTEFACAAGLTARQRMNHRAPGAVGQGMKSDIERRGEMHSQMTIYWRNETHNINHCILKLGADIRGQWAILRGSLVRKSARLNLTVESRTINLSAVTVAFSADWDQEHKGRPKKIMAECPTGVSPRVVSVLALRPTKNHRRTKMPKFLFIQRSRPQTAQQKPQQPSPAQMQEMYAAFNVWKEKFKDNIVDMGGKLKAGGKVVSQSGTTDGPFVESKEVVGGYMLVSAESIERAIEVAKESPGVISPGSSVEVREIQEMPGS